MRLLLCRPTPLSPDPSHHKSFLKRPLSVDVTPSRSSSSVDTHLWSVLFVLHVSGTRLLLKMVQFSFLFLGRLDTLHPHFLPGSSLHPPVTGLVRTGTLTP